ANYFYSYRPEGGTPLEWFFNWGKETTLLGMEINIIYIALSALLGIVVLFLFKKIYELYYKFKKSS
ncbi:MAG: hypothetical protein ACOX7D_04420, partial [Alphaproteobacteria bacterium]